MGFGRQLHDKGACIYLNCLWQLCGVEPVSNGRCEHGQKNIDDAAAAAAAAADDDDNGVDDDDDDVDDDDDDEEEEEEEDDAVSGMKLM